MKNVILLEPLLAHYRRDVFDKLVNNRELNISIVAGSGFNGIKSLSDPRYKTFEFLSFKLAGHEFYYLKGAVRFILSKKPDAIICTGVDFHQLHTIILFFIQRLIKGKKFFWWSHATLGNQGAFGKWVRKVIYKNSTGIMAYSENGKNTLIREGINAHSICVVNNSLNSSDYGFLTGVVNKTAYTEPLNLIFCGRITKSKKLDLLIKALSKINQQKLTEFYCEIVGAGDAESLVADVKQNRLENKIIFTGELYDSELSQHLLRSDLMVYPGGIGLSIVQSLSYGIPVITTDKEELHGPEIELLDPGKNGDLYKDGSVEDLAEKIMQWKLKLLKSRNEIATACIQSVNAKGYLPEVVSQNAIHFLVQKLNSNQ